MDLLNQTDDFSQQIRFLNEKKKWQIELERSRADGDEIKMLYVAKKLAEICKALGENVLYNVYDELIQKLNVEIKIESPAKRRSISDEVREIKEKPPKNLSQAEILLKKLIANYMKDIKTVMAIVIFNRSGSIIASESKIKSANISEIGASVIKMPKIFDTDKDIEKHPIRVICPTCKQNKKIFIPVSIVREAQNVVTFSIPNKLVCEHQFQVFVDKNFAIRGYQRVDYEIDSYMDRIIKEVGKENEFFNITVTPDKKVAYCSMGPNSIITSIAEPSASDIELKVYSEHVATKTELILNWNENVEIEIPQVIKTMAKTKGGELPEGEFSTKIIMTGNYKVGKTSLVNRFVRNLFREGYQSTIGVDLSEKEVDIKDKTKVKFVIWDIGGQLAQIAPFRQRFFEGANAAFIVFDRTRPEALNSIDLWYNEIKSYVPENINIIIVGNKTDLTKEIQISEDDIKDVADKFGFHYILTSAKTGENVNEAFLYIAYKFLETL
jgi:small GTP-binding protein